MTTFTPIRRHRPLFETSCTGKCNQGRACTCADLADKGTTLAANDAIERDEEAASFAAHMRHRLDLLIPGAVLVGAVLGFALMAWLT